MLIRCKALRAFTQFVPGHGQVHGDPDNREEAVQFPKVPESYVQLLVDEDKIEAPEPMLDDMCAAIVDAIDNSTNAPSETANEDAPRTAPLFTVTHVAGPNFDVFGPGMAAPERVKGKAAAEALAAELEAAFVDAMSAPSDAASDAADADTGTEDAAPV